MRTPSNQMQRIYLTLLKIEIFFQVLNIQLNERIPIQQHAFITDGDTLADTFVFIDLRVFILYHERYASLYTLQIFV